MNWSFNHLLKNFVKENTKIVSEVLDNGMIVDKRDIEDPTAKFCGPVHVGEVFRSRVQRSNVSFNKSEYDLPMIANAVQLDGILRRAVNIFVEHVLKNGYEFNSKNDKIQKHTIKRIKEIQNFTGISFAEILNQIVTQLVTYGNSYVVKVRKKDLSKFGKQYRLYGRENNPIVGLFVLDASTVEVGLNPQGYVVTYKQTIRGEAREWDERDIIHFTYNKIPGTLTGQSQILPVLDDVRALRKLEEEIEILGFQYSIPLYLYKVGTKDIPAAPGELDSVSSEVTNMPAYGMLVVPGHHSIEIPTNNNSVMDIIKYVDHFKQRIYSGLGISPIAMGEADSANRATSEVLDVAMQTITKSYQQIIKSKLELEFIREILLDGNFNGIDDELSFNFPEIDLENQIKKETHIVQLWQNNLITRTEARLAMDYEVNINDADTFLSVIDIPKLEAQTKMQIKVNSSKEASSGTGSSSGGVPNLPKPNAGGTSVTKVTHKITSPPQSKNSKSTSNKNAPANQYGKKTRPKFVKNSIDSNIFDGLTIFNNEEFSHTIEKNLKIHLMQELDYTMNNICSFYHLEKPNIENVLLDSYFSGLNLIIRDKVKRMTKFLDDDIKLSMSSNQIKEFFNLQNDKIENLAKILLCKSLGFKTILITSDACENHSDVNIDIAKMNFSKIPPFGYNCKCEVDEENFNEFK